jgi:hypothetical protein
LQLIFLAGLVLFLCVREKESERERGREGGREGGREAGMEGETETGKRCRCIGYRNAQRISNMLFI